MVKCSKLHPPPDKDGNCKEGYYVKNNKCCYKIKKPLKKKQPKHEINNVKQNLKQTTESKIKELKKEDKDNTVDDSMDKKEEEVPKNVNAIKKRTIRELKNGKKKTVSQVIIDKYNWTKEELEILKPYINTHIPNKILNDKISVKTFTKKEAYDVINKYSEKEGTKKTYISRVNALLKLCEINDEDFSKIFDDKLIDKIRNKYKDPTPYFGFLLFILSKSDKLSKLVPEDTFENIKETFEKNKNKQTVVNLNNRQEDIGYEKVYNDIFEKEKQLSEKEYGSMKHVIAIMYTKALYSDQKIVINPRNYFLKVKLVKKDSEMNKKDNFYNTETGRLLLNSYKTSGIYKPYDVILANEVQKVITKSLKLFPREYLIEKQNGGLYKNNSLSEMIQRVMGYNIDTIRKSIESYEINVRNEDRIHLAEVSRHSVTTQEISYLSK